MQRRYRRSCGWRKKTVGDRPMPKAVQAVRALVMAPERRVGDRNDGAMAQHVQRAREARAKAMSKEKAVLSAFNHKV